ncbi:MAG TPA: hypothetical protein VFG06_09330, partial [Thermodesulfovibrionales bacterium]|nr:hypothetical protein [Thermodesulfovibrionales bacterium]
EKSWRLFCFSSYAVVVHHISINLNPVFPMQNTEAIAGLFALHPHERFLSENNFHVQHDVTSCV